MKKLILILFMIALVTACNQSGGENSDNDKNENVEPNARPVVVSIEVNTIEETSVDFTLSATDSDEDELTYSIGDAANGTVQCLNTDCSYLPSQDFVGEEVIVISVSDGKSTVTSTVSIHVSNVNDAPVIEDQQIFVSEGISSTVLSLEYTDPDDAAAFSFEAVSQPSDGTIICGTTCSYNPKPGFLGTETFQVRVFDGESYSETATVTLTVKEMIAITEGHLSPVALLASHSQTKWKLFATNQGESPSDIDSINSYNLRYQYDLSTVDTSIARITCPSSYYGKNLPNACEINAISGGDTSFRVKVSNGLEESEWRDVIVYSRNAPEAYPTVISNTYDGEMREINLKIIDKDNDIETLVVSKLSQHILDGNIIILKNDTPLNEGDIVDGQVNIDLSATYKMFVKEGFLLSETKHTLFEYHVTDAFGYQGINELTLENSNGAIRRNPKYKQILLAQTTIEQHRRLAKVLEYSNPWKDWTGTCNTPSDVWDRNNQDMIDFRMILSDLDGWQGVYFKDEQGLYVVAMKEVLPGVKVFVTPYEGNGSKVRVNITEHDYSYNVEYAQEGSTWNWNGMRQNAHGLLGIFMRNLEVYGIQGLAPESRFQIDVVLSDSDLVHDSFTFDNSDERYRKTKYMADDQRGLWFSGMFKGSETYKLDMRHICGESLVTTPFPTHVSDIYWAPQAVERWDIFKDVSWLSYGETDNRDRYSKEISYAFHFEHPEYNSWMLVMDENENNVYTIASDYNSFYDINRKKGGLTANFWYFNDVMNEMIPGFDYDVDAYVKTFSFYQYADESNGNELYISGRYEDNAEGNAEFTFTNQLYYTSPGVDSGEIQPGGFLLRGWSAPTWIDL